MVEKFLDHIPSWLKNKYFLTAAGFSIWILFADDRDLITTEFRHKVELKKLEMSKKYYESQIAAVKSELAQLKTDPTLLEKYAREKYFMKRDNEDVYLIRAK
jgi:cell division protein FtsB